ncbi:MAG: type II toxin-antitoxin system Y4mF family antitoxin [Chitinophagaceae bacterium]
MSNVKHISNFVRYNRSKSNLTQQELAGRAGVGLRFIRDLEQGKETVRLDKVNQVLSLFGHTVWAGSQKQEDPYEMMLLYHKQSVTLVLRNRTSLEGLLADPVMVNNEIVAWKFVPEKNKTDWQKNKSDQLVEIVDHTQIESVNKSE